MKVNAAGIFIIRNDGKLLICHPTNHPLNVWSIPKGRVDEGETFLEAAIRETFEESNINVSDCKVIYSLESVNYTNKKKILHPFLLLEIKNPNLNLGLIEVKCNSYVPEDKGGFLEVDIFLWVDLDEAQHLLHPTQASCIPKIKQMIEEM